jgi:hypothetical protein
VSAPIGPSLASGWVSQFSNQSQFGSGQFNQGTNTFMPLPAIPVAQAFRYWWSCQTWRVQASLTRVGVTHALDSGVIPYGVGYSNTFFSGLTYPERSFCNLNGDQTAAPRLADRYLNGGIIDANGGDEFLGRNCIGNIFENFQVVSGNSSGVTVWLGMMGQRQYPAANTLSTTPLGLVFDGSNPPKVFMCFSIQMFMADAGGSFPISTIKAFAGGSSAIIFQGTLDGMPFDLYGSSGITGSLTITTAT